MKTPPLQALIVGEMDGGVFIGSDPVTDLKSFRCAANPLG
jgi:hypothetical protein